MELKKINRYVNDRLELSGINGQSVGLVVYTALRHVLMAVGIHETMTGEERAVFQHMRKDTQKYFASKFDLKERKRSKEKKNLPPDPLPKEKETKEKERQNLSIVADAREAFRKECMKYVGQYGAHRVEDFYRHWTEENPRTGKMRFQGKRYWNTETRLKRWMENEYSVSNEIAAMRKQRLEKRQTDAQQQQQAAAQQRSDDNERLEQEIRERKKGAVSYEEWRAMREKK